jgi:hypothetical protein
VLEYRYLRDVERAHGLPRSRHQVRVVIDGKTVYRDVYYEEYQLAVELDGRLTHPEEERWRDSQRDNQASAHGVETRRYGWRDVYAHACETALLQAQILRQRAGGEPRARAPRAVPWGAPGRRAKGGVPRTTTRDRRSFLPNGPARVLPGRDRASGFPLTTDLPPGTDREVFCWLRQPVRGPSRLN